jgi:DNA-binding LacI/PurR family transcriptional regulator
MTPKRSPSAHDVAELAGVSQAAVSRAFTEGASISDAMRTRVVRAAQELGYRPNLLARSLITGKSGIIGVVIGNPRNPFCVAALDMLSVRLAEAQKHILVFTVDGACDADVQVSDLINFRVDALVLVSAALSPDTVRECQQVGIPVLYFSRVKQQTPDSSSVTGENRIGASAIARHFVEQGYRRLSHMIGYKDSWTNHEREAGFEGYLRDNGLPRPQTVIGHYQREGAIAAARMLLSQPGRPDAIFCASDHMACATIEVARYEFGLEIGRDLGVAGFDDIEQAAWPSFDLTTYSVPIPAMMDSALAWLLGETRSLGHVAIPGALVTRGSTRRG